MTVDKIMTGFIALLDLVKNDQQIFWLIVGGAVVVLIIVLALVSFSSEKRRKTAGRKQSKSNTAQKEQPFEPHQWTNIPQVGPVSVEFAPIEPEQEAAQEESLSLAQKIIKCGDNLDLSVQELIVKRSPGVLSEILEAWPAGSPMLQNDLAALVSQLNMLPAYAGKIVAEQYSPDVLIQAWPFFGEEKMLAGFVELLAHKEERVQMAGVKLLTGLQDQRLITPVAMALMQPGHYVTARVADVFISLGKPAARLLAFLLPEVNGENKVRVLQVLSQIKTEYPPENVVICLNDHDPLIRVAAVESLGANRFLDATSALLIATEDQEPKVRAAAAKALGMSGNRAIEPLLQTLSKDSDWVVAASAKEALVALQHLEGEVAL